MLCEWQCSAVLSLCKKQQTSPKEFNIHSFSSIEFLDFLDEWDEMLRRFSDFCLESVWRFLMKNLEWNISLKCASHSSLCLNPTQNFADGSHVFLHYGFSTATRLSTVAASNVPHINTFCCWQQLHCFNCPVYLTPQIFSLITQSERNCQLWRQAEFVDWLLSADINSFMT